eukprot:6194057-Pleurochrysis_carterae.AAC.1
MWQGGDVTDDVAQPLVKVSSRAFVDPCPASTQRTAGHAEAEREKGEIRAGRAPSPLKVSPLGEGDGDDGAPGTSEARSSWETDEDRLSG